MNGESLGQFFVLGSINLGDVHWWVLLAKLFGGKGILWSEFLAVSTKGKSIVSKSSV